MTKINVVNYIKDEIRFMLSYGTMHHEHTRF